VGGGFRRFSPDTSSVGLRLRTLPKIPDAHRRKRRAKAEGRIGKVPKSSSMDTYMRTGQVSLRVTKDPSNVLQ